MHCWQRCWCRRGAECFTVANGQWCQTNTSGSVWTSCQAALDEGSQEGEAALVCVCPWWQQDCPDSCARSAPAHLHMAGGLSIAAMAGLCCDTLRSRPENQDWMGFICDAGSERRLSDITEAAISRRTCPRMGTKCTAGCHVEQGSSSGPG